MDYKAIHEYANAKNLELTCDNGTFNGKVCIKHNDGTILKLRYAFTEEGDDYIIAFTEHHGFFIYPKDEIVWDEERYEK